MFDVTADELFGTSLENDPYNPAANPADNAARPEVYNPGGDWFDRLAQAGTLALQWKKQDLQADLLKAQISQLNTTGTAETDDRPQAVTWDPRVGFQTVGNTQGNSASGLPVWVWLLIAAAGGLLAYRVLS